MQEEKILHFEIARAQPRYIESADFQLSCNYDPCRHGGCSGPSPQLSTLKTGLALLPLLRLSISAIIIIVTPFFKKKKISSY